MYDGSEAFGFGIVIFYLVYVSLVSSLLSSWSVLSYVLQSKSLYAIARRRGIEKPWLAWVPVGSAWILGCISDQFRYVARGQVKNKRKTLVVLEILLCVVLVVFLVLYFAFIIGIIAMADSGSIDSVFPALGSMLGFILMLYGLIAVCVVYSVFSYMAMYDLFRSCDPKRHLIYFLVGIFTSYPLPFFLYACRNKDLGMPPRQEPGEPAPEGNANQNEGSGYSETQ